MSILIIKITLVEAIKDMSIVITAKQSELQTRTNKKLRTDFQQTIQFGTQLPQLFKEDMRDPISWMQDSTIMDIFRLFPFYLLFFNQIQGILIFLIADIRLSQRFYEILRLFSCFVFKNIEQWPVSQEHPHSLPQQSIFGHYLETTDQNMHISRLGIHENLFAQVFIYFIVLKIFWILYFIFSYKKNLRAKNIMVNLISSYHKITLLLFMVVLFNQVRLLKHLNSSISIASLIFTIIFLFYMSYITIITVKKALKKNDEELDQTVEQTAYYEIRNSMRFYFLSCSTQININHNENNKLTSKIVNYYPLFSFLFKVYIAFILVFMQQTKQAQIIILNLSYLLYFLFSLRFFITSSRAIKILKILSQIIFLGLLLFTLINSLLIDSEINSLPSNTGHIISESTLNSINGLDILQILLMSLYFLLETSIKVFQILNLIDQFKNIQFYDSNNRIYIPKKQIQQISNAFIEMLNTQKLNGSQIILNNKQQDSHFTETKYGKENNEFQSYFQNSLKNSIVLAFKPNSQQINNVQQIPQIANNIDNSQIYDMSIQKDIDLSMKKSQRQFKKNENFQNQQVGNDIEQVGQINIITSPDDSSDQSKKLETIKIGDFQNLNQIARPQPQPPLLEFNPQKNTSEGNENQDFLKIPTNLKPILKPSKYQDPNYVQSQIQQNNNPNQILIKGSSAFSCDQSDIDDFSSIQKVLTIETDYREEDSPNMNESFKNLMKSKVKSIQIQGNLQKYVNESIDAQKQNKLFREAINPYSLLISQETIEKVKNKYDNDSYEFINTIFTLKEATISLRRNSNETVKKIEPYYSQRNFSITKHNYIKYEELIDLCKKKKGNRIQINTRIFFDIESYPIDSKINVNSHCSYTYCFQMTS